MYDLVDLRETSSRWLVRLHESLMSHDVALLPPGLANMPKAIFQVARPWLNLSPNTKVLCCDSATGACHDVKGHFLP